MRKQRNNTGQFVETATLDDVLAAFDAVEGPPVVTSADIADATGLSPDSARRKLNTLRDRGQVARRKTAGRVMVYWRTADTDNAGAWDAADERQDEPSTHDAPAERERLEGTETTPTEADATHGQDTPTDDGEGKRSGKAPSSQASSESRELPRAERILRDLDLPGQGAKLDARIDALLTLYTVLQERREPMDKSALLSLVDPDDVGYTSDASFWNNCVKANKSQGRDTNALVALPGIEDWGDGQYRYVDDESA